MNKKKRSERDSQSLSNVKMIIIQKDVDYKTRNKRIITVREEIKYTEEEYNSLKTAMFIRARKMRMEKYNRLSKLRKQKFQMLQYHQRLMLEAENDREFNRLQEVYKYLEYDIRDIDAELKDLSTKL